jgi:hypothetical protein
MKVLLGMLIGGLLVAMGMGVARAQNPSLTPYQVTVTAKCVGNMNLSSTGQATVCFGVDGGFISLNGAAAVQFAPAGAVASPALTLNGTTKTLPASFTLSIPAATISAPTASAPAITAQ